MFLVLGPADDSTLNEDLEFELDATNIEKEVELRTARPGPLTSLDFSPEVGASGL